MIKPETEEAQKRYLDYSKKQLKDMRKYLEQASEILEKRTYLKGGWPEDLWLSIKSYLQTEIESLKKHVEFLEKTKR